MNSTVCQASVVVPCHNARAFIRETVDSILSQGIGALDVILVDDGSTDGSGDFVENHFSGRVSVISTPATGGPSRPRNLGAEQAQGDLIFFCDADDVMLPGKIRNQLDFHLRHPEAGLSFTNFEVIDSVGTVLKTNFLAEYPHFWALLESPHHSEYVLPNSVVFGGLLSGNFIGTSGVAVRADVFQKTGGFDENLRSSEDLDLWLRIASQWDLGFLNRIGHSYRKHQSSLMQEFSPDHPEARIRVLEKHLPATDDFRTRQSVNKLLAQNFNSLGYYYRKKQKDGMARRYYQDGLRRRVTMEGLLGLGKTYLP